MEPLSLWPASPHHWLKQPLFCLWLVLACCCPALAADSYYINNGIVNYPDGLPYPPQIDATNFINNNQFTINFTVLTVDNEFYDTSDTVNYTNTGTMAVNTGFQFDTLSSIAGVHTRAGSFNNSGFINCGSFTFDPTATFVLGFGQCLINATNIQINSGGGDGVDVGVDGLIQITGQNVDLHQSLLNVENFGASASGTPFFGLNTNLWDPSLNLNAIFAVSPIFPIAPGQLVLFPSVAYTNMVQAVSNDIITRAVFIEDTSPSNVSYSVFIGPEPAIGPGEVTIQWAGSYLDPASDTVISNYLYLNDDIELGASTNVLPLFAGVLPGNFTLVSSTTPLITDNPTPLSQFINSFQPGGITNLYDCFNGQLTVGTGTNSVANASITNLPGRVQITGDSNLDLNLAQITGPNYMSLKSTNQFHGSAGAFIQTPYADLNLGVTNGFLNVSNTMEANIPDWGGQLVVWNTRWVEVSATGVTNDYRVLLVSSHFTPSIAAQVQNLVLHGTNTMVISDAFNVMSTFSADAQSLILTTNPPVSVPNVLPGSGDGNGATSLDGELNLNSPNIFWQSSVPNLRYLTNYGAIRMQNLANFGFPYVTNVTGGTTNVASFLYNTAFINYGIFMDQGSIIYAGNFESGDVVSNGVGSFMLQSLTTTLTNGFVFAGGDVSITTGSLLTSNLTLQAGRSLTLLATNLLTDTGPSPTNNSSWAVGTNGVGSGISLPIKPASGDLLGTTLTLSAPTNRTVANLWAGNDYGLSTAGYTNNEAIGRLRLDVSPGGSPGHNGVLTFSGAGVSNAVYVDQLILTNYATQGNGTNNFNFAWLKINTNMFIYFAQALETSVSGSSVDVSEAIDDQSKIGANGGRLRWIWSYAGFYSSTNILFTNLTTGAVITNTVNTALAQSKTIDSDSDGIPNYSDPTPFFLSPELNFTAATTNLPPQSVKVQWTTIPNATNFIYFTTNLFSTNWLAFTNFQNWYYGNNVAVTNAAHGNSFHSPQVYINNPALPDNSQQTNVWIYDAISDVPHYYKVVVWPWINFPE